MKATFVGQVPELGVIVLLSLSHLIDEVAVFLPSISPSCSSRYSSSAWRPMMPSYLAQDNTRIWQTHYEPKPLSQLYSGWQEMLVEHRQIVVQVQEIAKETGWRGPERHVNLQWDWRGGSVV